MAEVKPNVLLMNWTVYPQTMVGMAGKLCYSPSTLSELFEKVEDHDQSKYLKKLVEMGHLSPTEHVSFTFGIEGVSRSFLAQITRHRIASFSVQSQRYVAMDGFDYIIPPAIAALGEKSVEVYRNQMKTIDGWYQQWRMLLGGDKAANEDARFVLPNAAATRLIVTMNARELMHFFEQRCCNRAQWEIRTVADEMLRLARAAAPELFEKAGCACMQGKPCPEGKLCCGSPRGSGDV